MATTLRGKTREGRSWTNEIDGEGNSNRTGVQVFLVVSDIPNEAEAVVAGTAGLPSPGDPFPGDAGIFAGQAQVSQNGESDYEWQVQFDYDNETAKDNDGEPKERNPLDRPVKISYGGERYSKLTGSRKGAGAAAGDWFTNSAGEPIDPQPEIDATRPTITFVKNIDATTFSWGLLESYIDNINDADIWGKPARTLKVMSITAGNRVTVNIDDAQPPAKIIYRPTTYVIQYNQDTWDIDAVDQGNYAKVDPLVANPQLNPKNFPKRDGENRWDFLDNDGNPEIRLLDGSGGLLPDGDPPVFIDPKPQGYPLLNFVLLDLPDPYALDP